MKFFIVDDDAEVLALLRRVLEGAGHRVETSTSASDALQRIPESAPDCTITDIMMPRMDGFELTRELRRARPRGAAGAGAGGGGGGGSRSTSSTAAPASSASRTASARATRT